MPLFREPAAVDAAGHALVLLGQLRDHRAGGEHHGRDRAGQRLIGFRALARRLPFQEIQIRYPPSWVTATRTAD